MFGATLISTFLPSSHVCHPERPAPSVFLATPVTPLHAKSYCRRLGSATMSRRRPEHLPTQPSFVTTGMTSFVGCMRNLDVTHDGSLWPGLQLYQAACVERDCVDPCATSTSRCANSGRCTNNYVTTSCDCYGTGFEGPRCQSKGLSCWWWWWHLNANTSNNNYNWQQQ